MPGRDYTRAYARLEESLGDTGYPTLDRSKPQQKRNLSHTFANHRTSPLVSSAKNLASKDTRGLHLRTEFHSPSPPQTSHRTSQLDDPSFGLGTGWKSPVLSISSGVSTPVDHGPSVTPNTTPPSLGSRPHSKPIFPVTHASSHADSFETAQEDIAADDKSQHHTQQPLHSTEQPSSVDDVGLRNFGWDMNHDAESNSVLDKTARETARGEVSGEFDIPTKVLPNVTIRRKRKHDKAQPTDLTFLDDGPRGLAEQPSEQESPHSWYDGSVEGEESGPPLSAKRENIGRASSDLDLARSISSSNKRKSTPIVEARIIESPEITPPRQRPLRHVHKQGILRDGSSEVGSPHAGRANDPSSARPPQPADHHIADVDKGEVLMRPVTPSRRATDPRNNLVDLSPTSPRTASSQRSPRLVQPKSSLKKRHESLDAAVHTDAMANSSPQSTGNTAKSGHSKIYGPLWPSSTEVLPDFAPRNGDASQGADLRPRDKATAEAIADRGGKVFPKELQYLSPLRSSDQLSSSTPGSFARESADPHNGTHSSALHSRMSPFSEASDGMVLQDAQTVSIFPHNNKSLVVVEHPRSAMQSRDESGACTRFEQDTPEDDHQVAMVPSNWVEMTRLQEDTPVEELLMPNKPSTPRAITCANFMSTDSPLTNPRRPPEPPSFSISVVPPPAVNDTDSRNGPVRTTSKPSRRVSLLERARTYSGNVVQPFRSYTERRRSARFDKRNSSAPLPDPNISAPIPPPHSQPPQVHSRDERLANIYSHQPRDFWDSHSSSSSLQNARQAHTDGPTAYEKGNHKGNGTLNPYPSTHTTPTATASSLNATNNHSNEVSQAPSRQMSLFNRGRSLPRLLSTRTASLVRRTSSSRPFSFVSSARASTVNQVSERDEVRLHELGVTALPPSSGTGMTALSTNANAPPSAWPRRGGSDANKGYVKSGLSRKFDIRDFMDRASSRGSSSRGSQRSDNNGTGIGAWKSFSGVHSRPRDARDEAYREDTHQRGEAGTLPGRLTHSLRARMRERSQRREEREREEQRERLRDSIGMKIFVPE